MMTVAGIDLDSNGIHVVRLNLDDDHAAYNRIRVDNVAGDYHARARRLRDQLPARGAWNDRGVIAIGIEEPKTKPGYGGLQSAVPQAVMRGALLACLPADIDLVLLPPYEWKRWSLGGGERGQGNADKAAVRAWALARWPNPPEHVTQDAFDAYAIAWATRRRLPDHADRRKAA